jgi:hypothetical protein
MYRCLLCGRGIGVCEEFRRRILNTVRAECIVVSVNGGDTYTNNYALNM